MQLPQRGQGAQRAGQDPAARLGQGAVLQAGACGCQRGSHARRASPQQEPGEADTAPRPWGGQAAGPCRRGCDTAATRPRAQEGQEGCRGPEPRPGWDEGLAGSPELLDLAGGALQALQHQVHAGIAQLVGAEAELGQGGVGPEGRTDVLAVLLREAAVVEPADRRAFHTAGWDPPRCVTANTPQAQRKKHGGHLRKAPGSWQANASDRGAVGRCRLLSPPGEKPPGRASAAEGSAHLEGSAWPAWNIPEQAPGPQPPHQVKTESTQEGAKPALTERQSTHVDGMKRFKRPAEQRPGDAALARPPMDAKIRRQSAQKRCRQNWKAVRKAALVTNRGNPVTTVDIWRAPPHQVVTGDHGGERVAPL